MTDEYQVRSDMEQVRAIIAMITIPCLKRREA